MKIMPTQTIRRKTLLYKSGVEYADYGLNHVEGCSHGCLFPCYAMMMKKRCGVISSYREWVQPKIVENTLELLDEELPLLKNKINNVFLSFSTDPFMYGQAAVVDLTLKVLHKLNDYHIKSTVITKGAYPAKLAERECFNPENEYGITLVSLSSIYKKRYEPGAAPISERIKALKRLHDSGLKTWVSMEPFPTPNIVSQDLRDILDEVSFVDKIVFGKWNYNKLVSDYLSYEEPNFYNEAAEFVLNYCRKYSINVHIKDKTLIRVAERDSLTNGNKNNNFSHDTLNGLRVSNYSLFSI